MAYFIFDLDGTVICSRHRANTLPDGSLDLANWIENCTEEKILKDSLLPMARAMQALYTIGHNIVICTARTWTKHDSLFLEINGLRYHTLLHRLMHPDAHTIGDGQLKIDLLNDYFRGQGFSSPAEAKAIMYDDNLKVIAAMQSIGIKCYNADDCNRQMLGKMREKIAA